MKSSTRGRIPCQSSSSPLMNQRLRSLGKITSWKLSWGSGARRSFVNPGPLYHHSQSQVFASTCSGCPAYVCGAQLSCPAFVPTRFGPASWTNGASSWEAQLSDFHTHHITIQDLSQAYSHLTTLQIIPVPFGASSGRQLAGLRQLLGTCNAPGLRWESFAEMGAPGGGSDAVHEVLIICDTQDPTQVCRALRLARILSS